MTDRDANELLAAMFAAWREEVDSVPFPVLEPAVLRGEHSTGEELTSF